jgi:putative endonuclease
MTEIINARIMRSMREYGLIAVYILASRPFGTLYIGVTSDLISRVVQHRDGAFDGFTKKYKVHRLVWYEQHQDIALAIQREKSLKRYRREWKLNLIGADNPHWSDLFPALLQVHGLSLPSS